MLYIKIVISQGFESLEYVIVYLKANLLYKSQEIMSLIDKNWDMSKHFQ